MKSIKLKSYYYTASLCFLLLLTTVCIGISGADVIIQSLTDRTSSGTFDYRGLVVIAGSYLLLKAYWKISDELKETRRIRDNAKPRAEDIQALGWAKPGKASLRGLQDFEGVDFKNAVAKTPKIVEKLAKEVNSSYARPYYVPFPQYVDYLIQQGVIHPHYGLIYLEGYEKARFSNKPLTQEEYTGIMKHLAAIVRYMGFSLMGNGDFFYNTHSPADVNTNTPGNNQNTSSNSSTSQRHNNISNNSSPRPENPRGTSARSSQYSVSRSNTGTSRSIRSHSARQFDNNNMHYESNSGIFNKKGSYSLLDEGPN
ncbi:hypothetical protein BDB01DRAFT_715424 [Pilobolus umbonatus]|nr:hypothetical protein BDB01DRAFT_715424 [Pilobolus umbonatus]